MRLFKKKPSFTKNLIYTEKGNIRFANTPTMNEVQANIGDIMKISGIFYEDFYRDVYKEYIKHHVVYDVVPTLLLYKLISIFSKRNPNYHFSDYDVKKLIPSVNIYVEEIPSSFKVPNYIRQLMDIILDNVQAYLPEEFNIHYFRRIFFYNYLKEWEVYLNNPSLVKSYMDIHIGVLIDNAIPENRIIVKNVIERTIEEYDSHQS